MQNNIPVPTDNIFKFYALFGLLLVVFTFSATIYLNESDNEFFALSFIALEGLKATETPSHLEEAKRAILERQIDIRKLNKRSFSYGLGIPLFFGIAGVWYGFWKWHKEVQPILDLTSKTQLKLLQLQLKNLELQTNKAQTLTSNQPRVGSGDVTSSQV